jgi:hypothetical protein
MEAFSYTAIAGVIFLFLLYWVIRYAVLGALEDNDRKRAKRYQVQPAVPLEPLEHRVDR